MNARQIFEALLAGRKVGNDEYYVYLNIEGNLMGSEDYLSPLDMLAEIACCGNAKCQPEEGW